MQVIDFVSNRYPSPVGNFVILSILKKSIDGYRVYSAIVPDVSKDDPTYSQYIPWVEAHGNKELCADASRIWSMITQENYAR
jgi:hypothetical protein